MNCKSVVLVVEFYYLQYKFISLAWQIVFFMLSFVMCNCDYYECDTFAQDIEAAGAIVDTVRIIIILLTNCMDKLLNFIDKLLNCVTINC